MQRDQSLSGRYVLLSPIGGGGMGMVWLAEDRRLKRDVAVKFLKSEHAHVDELRTRFEIEAQAMARINHPCVAEIYDVGNEGNQPYIVMEFVNGQTLTRFLRDHAPLSERVALEWLESIARGVAAIHRKSLIHRDLKPNNILLPNGGEREHLVKIVDFGIARTMGGISITTEMGRHFFTPEYASPEQSVNLTLTPASDVYTLGVILYEMLGGSLPANLFSLRGKVSDTMFALLSKLLQHDPQARPQDGSAVLELIRQFGRAGATTRPDSVIAAAAPTPPATPVLPHIPPDTPTRVHPSHAPTPSSVAAAPPKPGIAQQMRDRVAAIQSRPAEELPALALIADFFIALGSGFMMVISVVWRGIANTGRRMGGVVQQQAQNPNYQAPAIGQSVKRAAGAASGGFYAALYGIVNGMVVGGIGGMVGGIAAWLLLSLTVPDTLNDLVNTLFRFNVSVWLRFFMEHIARWVFAATTIGGALGAVLGFVLGLTTGGRGTYATRSLPMKLLYALFSGIGAVVWGLFLTFTHMVLAAIPLGLWSLSDPRVPFVLLRLDSINHLFYDLCYWAALSAVGWSIALSVDTLFDRAISRTAWGNLFQAVLSAFLGALALGSGSYVLWVVLSGAGITDALNPSVLFTHLWYDPHVKVGFLGGLIIGLLRRRRVAPPTAVVPPVTPRGAARPPTSASR